MPASMKHLAARLAYAYTAARCVAITGYIEALYAEGALRYG